VISGTGTLRQPVVLEQVVLSKEAERDDPQPSEARPLQFRRIRVVAWLLFAAQLIGLLVFSTIQYQTFALGSDFGGHAQAWFAIAHGHLDPWSSIFGVPFWRNNAEFLLWPLSLLYYVYPHSVDLLWVQDVAVVATELVVFTWICEVIERRRFGRSTNLGPVLAFGSVIALVANPWIYQTIAFDFHMEPLTALFAVLAGYALWAGRLRQLWWWVPLALLTAGLGGLVVCALGVSGILAGRRTRVTGVILVLVGAVWFVGLGALGAISVGGQQLAGWYGYLTGSHGHVGIFNIAFGLIRHPAAALHMAVSRWPLIFGLVSVVGLIGVLSPWGLPMIVFVLGPGAFNSNVSFLLPHASFQNWPALPFVLVGSVMVLLYLDERTSVGYRIARAVGAFWLAALIPLAIIAIPEVPNYWLSVSAPAAKQLGQISTRLPLNEELITSGGIVGRLAIGSHVYYFFEREQLVPVDAPQVDFIFAPEQGVSATPPSDIRTAMTFVQHRLGAREVVAKNGVYELKWSPPAGTTRVVIP
jgi:Predicted membrane protein (DUF2079)